MLRLLFLTIGENTLLTIAVIPARYASTRFPGKPLAIIAGKPMIQWVYERVERANCFDSVIVATDDNSILETVLSFGGIAEITSPTHVSGTDRVWEVASKIENASYVFNIQGDEPFLNPDHLEEAVNFLKFHHEIADIITLRAPVQDISEVEDPNIVKIVTSKDNRALYFSRSSIPYIRDSDANSNLLKYYYRHIGLYGFKRNALKKFVQLSVSPLEKLEKLEQLRALEAGLQIYALPVKEAAIGVDTPEDLLRVEKMIVNQSIV